MQKNPTKDIVYYVILVDNDCVAKLRVLARTRKENRLLGWPNPEYVEYDA